MVQTQAQPEFLTPRQVGARLGIAVETVRALCLRYDAGLPGGLPNFHVGTEPASVACRQQRRVSRDDLEQFIRDRQREKVRETLRESARRPVERKRHEWV